ADLSVALGEWKGQRVMKNVPVIHSQSVLDVHGAFAFDARAAITGQSEAFFFWLLQPLVDAGKVFFLRFPPHLMIIPHKQAPRRIQSEERHRVKALLAQLRREDAVVS